MMFDAYVAILSAPVIGSNLPRLVGVVTLLRVVTLNSRITPPTLSVTLYVVSNVGADIEKT
ncbi:hypothetical protein D3C71_2097810 [compost metagenome]